MLAGNKPTMEGESPKGNYSCEGTLLCIGNPVGKASNKPHGGIDLSGK
jgi:hypothetical protein